MKIKNNENFAHFIAVIVVVILCSTFWFYTTKYISNLTNKREKDNLSIIEEYPLKEYQVEVIYPNGKKEKYNSIYDYETSGDNRNLVTLFFKDGTKLTFINTSIKIKETN